MKAGAITSPSSLFQISLLSLLLSGGMVPLNAQWSGQDVGAPSPAGSWSVSSGAYTVNGSGADIWGAADQFQFVWQAITGDVTVTARVTAQQNTNAWAKAGVMIREDLSAGSRHAMTAVTPGNGTAFQNRAATNGTSLHTASSGTVPVWVRISRTGNTLTSYRSTDGFS